MQTQLWHDALEDALKDVVHAMGGPKAVGSMLWPDKPLADAARYLNQCLDQDRAEKLSLSQLVFLMQKAGEKEIHTAIHFLCDACGYQTPARKDPETEYQTLQREFIQSANRLDDMMKRMERLKDQRG